MTPTPGAQAGPRDHEIGTGAAVFVEVLHASALTQTLTWGLGVGAGGLSLAISSTAGPLVWPDAVIALVSVGIGGAVARMSSAVLVEPEGVRLGFRIGGIPVWRRRIRARDIERVEKSTVDALSAGGLGLRFLGGGRAALMVRQGDAVRIVLADGWRQYLVATDRADELEHALSALVAPTR